jgi:hypothetical protein
MSFTSLSATSSLSVDKVEPGGLLLLLICDGLLASEHKGLLLLVDQSMRVALSAFRPISFTPRRVAKIKESAFGFSRATSGEEEGLDGLGRGDR